MGTPHSNQIIMAYLLTQSGVTDLIGTGDAARLYVGAVPAEIEDERIDETIVIKKTQEESSLRGVERTSPVVTVTVDILCLGPTKDAADTLSRVLDDALDQVPGTLVSGVGAILLSHKQPANVQKVAAETEWDFLETTYRITVQ